MLQMQLDWSYKPNKMSEDILDPSDEQGNQANTAKRLFKMIIGGIIIAFVLLLTILYIKVLPPLIKVLALAVNACVIYMCYAYLFKNKKK